MITGIDHIALEVANIPQALEDYSAVLGRPRAASDDRLQLDNLALQFRLPSEAGAADAPAQLRLVLAAADVAATAHRLTRRALPGTLLAEGDVFEIDTAVTHGVAIGVTKAAELTQNDPSHDIAGLDHVVVSTPDPERAVALYGGRLGLDLRLDRTNPEHNNRLLFFVCGGLVVEISHNTKKGVADGPDRIFGLAWRARDIDRARARMAAQGIDVSEIRTGRRAGTRVFTVRNRTAGVPTLIIGGEGLERS
jgi:catechol 2,3-dioxygenase-like lactoylglutathione lyase family enzyme